MKCKKCKSFKIGVYHIGFYSGNCASEKTICIHPNMNGKQVKFKNEHYGYLKRNKNDNTCDNFELRKGKIKRIGL